MSEKMLSNLIVARPFRAITMGRDKELIVATAGCRFVSTMERRALEICSQKMEEHGRQILNLMNSGSLGEDAALHTLKLLRAKGLIVTGEQLVAEYRARPSSDQVCPIESIGIITRDRPFQLLECARSLLANAHKVGRQIELVVVDDSPCKETRSQNLTALESLASLATVRYVGLPQRIAYCHELTLAGIPPKSIESALGTSHKGDSYGSTRNVLLLDLAGTALLSADDDTIGRLAVHPERGRELCLIGHSKCFDYQFFESREKALEWAEWAEGDLIGEHCKFLGKSLSTCIKEAFPAVNVDQLCSHWADPLIEPRVVGTFTGKIGDSGRLNQSWVDWLDTDGQAIAGNAEVAELPKCPSIVHHIGCMATMVGIDNRKLLPPFMPRFRNEDGVFGATLARIAPQTCWGVVPYGIIHNHLGKRNENEVVIRISFSEVVMAVLNALPRQRPGTTVDVALRDIGNALRQTADLGSDDLRRVILESLGRYFSGPIQGL